MNRIVLIGNGFDLAHGLKTSYADFINWYWEQLKETILHTNQTFINDGLITVQLLPRRASGFLYYFQYGASLGEAVNWSGDKLIELLSRSGDFEIEQTAFLEEIMKSIEEKKWVDIERIYYDLLNESRKENSDINIEDLNQQLQALTNKLCEYLKDVEKNSAGEINASIKEKIYEPIILQNIAIGSAKQLNQFISERVTGKTTSHILFNYKAELSMYQYLNDLDIENLQTELKHDDINNELQHKNLALLPEYIMVVNFNYTSTVNAYLPDVQFHFLLNNIHGSIDNPQSVIFGYGDEMDKHYPEIEELNNNEYLNNVKSIKYLESEKYRELLDFIKSAPYQIYIMGHSCGNSDRTLLNTLFEHENCVSIKPFYYQKTDGTDNYRELVQNISRNFKDKKLLRDRVVNKTYCEPMPQAKLATDKN